MALTVSRAWYSKSRSHGVELLLHFFDSGLLFFPAFRREARLVPFQLCLSIFQPEAIGVRFAQLLMQAIQKLTNISSLRAQARPCSVNDGRVQAQALRDVEACGRARHADFQFIRRLQRGFVESNRGIHHSRSVCAVYLERSVVGGDYRDAPDPAEMVRDGDRQRRSFFGVGGRAEFVQEYERSRCRGAGDEIDVGDVRREGRKILLDRLVVANIGKHRIENRQLGSIRGNGYAGLRHQGQQSHSFQGYGFAASVWASNHQFQTFRFHLDADGDDVAAFRLEVSLEQRVPRVVKDETRSVPYLRGRSPGRFGPLIRRAKALLHPLHTRAFSRELHRHTAVIFREARLGKLQFEVSQSLDRQQDLVCMLADAAGHLQQDAMDFGLFIIQQTHQFVVLFDRLQWLHEDGLSAGTGAVYDSLHPPLLFDLDRYNEAFAPDRDQLILYRPAFGEPAKIAAQRFLDRPLLPFDLPADSSQLRRGPVFQCAVRLDLVAKGTQEIGEVGDAGGKLCDRVPLHLHGRGWAEGNFPPLCRPVNDQHHVANLGGFQNRAGNSRLSDNLCDVQQSGKFEAASNPAELANFSGELMLFSNPIGIDGRRKSRNPLLAERRRGVSLDQFAQRLEFEYPGAGVNEWAGRHRIHVTRSRWINYRGADIWRERPRDNPTQPAAVAVSASLGTTCLAAGKRSSKAAPPSGRFRQVIRPLWSWTIPYVTLSPSPMPLPTGLVV